MLIPVDFSGELLLTSADLADQLNVTEADVNYMLASGLPHVRLGPNGSVLTTGRWVVEWIVLAWQAQRGKDGGA